MVQSALVGQKPATKFDELIIEGWWRIQQAQKHNKRVAPYSEPHPPILPIQRPANADNDTNGPEIQNSCIVLIVITILITGTRLLLRLTKRDLRWGLDDWAIVVGAGLVIAWASCGVVHVVYGGAGKHMYNLTYREYERYFEFAGIGPILFYVSLGFIKISICLFNRRLTGLTSKRWSIYHYSLLVALSLYIIAVVLGMCLQCMPVWVPFTVSSFATRDYYTQCMDTTKLAVALGGVHIMFDIFLLPVPLVVMWRLNLTKWQRARMVFLFGIGFMSFVGAIMRAQLIKVQKRDSTYTMMVLVNRWSIVDIVFAVAVASLPTLNALLPASWRQRPSAHATPPEGHHISSPKNSSGTGTPSGNGDTRSQVDSSKSGALVADMEAGGADTEMWENKRWSENRNKSVKAGSLTQQSGAQQPNWEKYAPNLRI